jgi:hypothetical protein
MNLQLIGSKEGGNFGREFRLSWNKTYKITRHLKEGGGAGREPGERVSYFLPGFGAHRDFNRSRANMKL